MLDLAVIDEKKEETKQYIIFRIDKEYFGIDISFINSIIEMPKIAKVPMTPDYIAGITNLRGDIVPIMSLRGRMNAGEENITKDSRVIIVNLKGGEMVGIIVDDVKEVMNISNQEISEPTSMIKGEETFISGVGRKEDELISIFEVDSLIA